MGKKCLKVLSMTILATGILFSSACSCNAGKVKVTFVTEGNSDIIRYVKKGKSLVDLPTPPEVKGKYCSWDKKELKNINEDTTVTAICYSTVTNLYTNIPDEINVKVSSDEASLDYIFKDAELEATFESGEKKKLYSGDYTIEASNYNKDVGGSYVVSVVYNNARKNVKINVEKENNYVTVSLDGGFGYYNEGLPTLIANTSVEGTLSFDEGQELYVGSKAYSWTFIPSNRDKYEIVKGNIDVYLYPASDIIANKDELVVPYGTSKNEIIEQIKDGLVVEAKYGNAYKVIDSKYYTIDCVGFSSDTSKTYEFKITYDSQNQYTVYVTLQKNEDYTLDVNDVSSFIMNNSTSINDVMGVIEKTSSVPGTISFVSGQALTMGSYEYDYIFTPDNANYAIKEGKIRINAYKAIELDYETISSYDYGSDAFTIIETLKNNIVGNVVYNDSYSLTIDKSKVSITLENDFSSTIVGEHEYTISYNNEIVLTDVFTINKRALQLGVDFSYTCDSVDPSNPEVLPACSIIKLNNNITDNIENLFVIIPLSSKDNGDGEYVYIAELIPDKSISEIYETITIEIIASIND